MPLLHHAVGRPFRRQRQTVQLTGQAGREVTDIDHLLHFAVAFGAYFAHLEADQITERLLLLAERVAEIRTSAPRRGAGSIRNDSNAVVAAETTRS